MGKPDVSVVIVSYNVWDYLKPCIQSLYAQKGISSEIIVVDNNSTDDTLNAISKEFPAAKLIANKDNKGFSGGNNQGINVAEGNNILLLNPDTELKKDDILIRLKECLGKDNPDGIVAPCLLNGDGTFQPSAWDMPGIQELFLELFYLHKSNLTKPEKLKMVEGASGAALFFSKKLIDEIGLLDEKMFWMEDMDFCYRAAKAGKKVLYNPDIRVVHHGGKSSANYSLVIPNQVMSKIKFYKKHGSWLKFIIMDKLSFWFILSRWCTFAVLSINGNDTYKRKRKAYSVTMKSFFRYNFSGDDAIIGDV